MTKKINSNNIIDIREHLKGSLAPQPVKEENCSSSLNYTEPQSSLISNIQQESLIAIEDLTYETKIIQAKVFLDKDFKSDAKTLFTSALKEDPITPSVYLTIIELLESTMEDTQLFKNKFKKLTEDLIFNIENTYMKNHDSLDFTDFLNYYEDILQKAFNNNIIRQEENDELLYDIIQIPKDIVELEDYKDIKESSEKIIKKLKKIAKTI